VDIFFFWGLFNSFVLSYDFYCSALEIIEIYFLPVGHTHGQIDQMFSALSKYLKTFPAKTLPELLYSLAQAYNNQKKKKIQKQSLLGKEIDHNKS
jgi:hypothetical protein